MGRDPAQLFVSVYGAGREPLYIWAGALIDFQLNDPLTSLRLASVIFGWFSLFGLILLTKQAMGKRFPNAPYLAGLLFILNPFALFHDRLAVYESMITAIGVWAFLVSRLLVMQQKGRYAIGLAILFAAGLSTKSYCIYFLSFPFILIVGRMIVERKWPNGRILLYSILAAAFSKGLHSLMHLAPLHIYGSIDKADLRYYLFPSMDEAVKGISVNLLRAGEIYWWYVGPPLIFIFAFFLFALLKKRESGAIALALCLIGAFAAAILLGYYIFARYLYFTLPFFLVGALWGLYWLIEWLQAKAPRFSADKLPGRLLFAAALIICMALPIQASVAILRDPATAPIDPMDKWQHITGWPSGYGIRKAAAYLKEKADQGPIDIFCKYEDNVGTPYEALRIYLDAHPNVRFHIAFWAEKKPVLFFAAQNITINNPVSQNMPAREDLRGKDLGDVYFVGNHPKLDVKRFKKLNQPFEETRVFYKPGKESAYIVFKLKKPPLPE